MKSLTKTILLFYLIILFSCDSGTSQQSPTQIEVPDAETAITTVNVIPMSSDTLLQNQTVLIKEGKIAAVGPSDLVTIPENAMVIDGSGKYLRVISRLSPFVANHVHTSCKNSCNRKIHYS